MKCDIIDNTRLGDFFAEQLGSWEFVSQSYGVLQHADMRTVTAGGIEFKLQHNGGRMNSVAANTSPVRQTGACILCRDNRPAEQMSLDFNNRYDLLVNPYPVFSRHFTIVAREHTPQSLAGRLGDMLLFARNADEYTAFYNGSGCGASVPGHMHFQAGERGVLPLERDWDKLRGMYGREIFSDNGLSVTTLAGCCISPVVFESGDMAVITDSVYGFIRVLPQKESMVNITASCTNGKYTVWVYPRIAHRPSCYYSEEGCKRLVSPAAVEASGLLILPRKDDYENITAAEISGIFGEVSLSGEGTYNACVKWLETLG